MQNRSIPPSTSTLRQPQSTAALLLEEIIDCVFDFLYRETAGITRDKTLSDLSVVTPNWTAAARRRLFRDVRIRSLLHFKELLVMEDSKLLVVRTLNVNFVKCGSRGREVDTDGLNSEALFKLLQKTPNLVELVVVGSSFGNFHPADSIIMRTSLLLPHLTKLKIITHDIPFPVLLDLLTTSNGRISHLSCVDYPYTGPISPPDSPLDFGRNLRYLSTEGTLNQSLLDSSRVVLGSLVGLEKLVVGVDSRGVSCSRMKGVFDVVAESLKELVVTGGADNVAQDLPSLTRLTHLTMDSVARSLTALRYLPPLLSFLFLNSDDGIAPFLESWKETPGTAPPNLRHLGIGTIHDEQTWDRLLPIEKFTAYWNSNVEQILEGFTPRSVPFRVLELKFRRSAMDAELEGTKGECARLGIELLLRKPDYS